MGMTKDTENLYKQVKVSDEVWMKAIVPNSIFNLARRIEMPGDGIGIQKVTQQPEAEWVLNEGGQKPVSDHALGKKEILPYEVAVIETFSDDFLEDDEKLANILQQTLAPSLLKKAARTFYGVAIKPSGATYMDTFTDCDAISFNSSVYDAISDLECELANDQYTLNGYILSPHGKRLVRDEKDNNGRPIFVDTPSGDGFNVGNIIGITTYQDLDVYSPGSSATSTPAQVGIAGDFNQAFYGLPSTIQIKISDSAAITSGGTTTSMFQTDQVAVRAKMRIGFGIMDTAAFRRITGAIPTNGNTKKVKK